MLNNPIYQTSPIPVEYKTSFPISILRVYDPTFYIKLSSWNLYTPPHWHNEIELLYFYDNNASGTVFCGYENIKIQQNLFVVCNPYEVHSITLDKPSPFLCIIISNELLTHFSIEGTNYQHAIYGNKTLHSFATSIHNIHFEAQEGYNLMIAAKICDLFSYLHKNHIYDTMDKSQRTKQLKKINRINSIIQYINEHYSEQLSPNTLSTILNLDENYFCHFFKNETGLPFVDYLNRLRIEKSKELLSKTNLSISQIANTVGFNDSNYYSRIFKKYTGIPPKKEREWRQNIAKKLTE